MTDTYEIPATVPRFNGRPVPWVTRWTEEINPERLQYGALVEQVDGKPRLKLAYRDGQEERDPDGVLWQREGIKQGGGEPDWRAVSTYRQRACMRHRKCQLCGVKIADTPMRWLMPKDGIEKPSEDEAITLQPPTCSDCIPIALDLCPHLSKNGYMILKVASYKLWGVFGHVVTFAPGGKPLTFQTAIGYESVKAGAYGDEFSLTQVMAQQQVVQLGPYVIEEIV